jgi:hypothetical protein
MKTMNEIAASRMMASRIISGVPFDKGDALVPHFLQDFFCYKRGKVVVSRSDVIVCVGQFF